MGESIRWKVVFVNTPTLRHTHVNSTNHSEPAGTNQSRSSIPRVAFQGALGAFSELAIRQYWPAGAIPIPQPTFDAAVHAALEGDAEFAIIPVENVIAGPVKPALETLDREQSRFTILGDTRLSVQMCLLAPPGTNLRDIQTVISHHMALAQCGQFFAQHDWMQPVVHGDTATAAADIASGKMQNAAALASEAAAERYGLEILARGVQDSLENWTRFVVLRANGKVESAD